MILCVKRDLANLSERSSVPQVKYRLLELFPPLNQTLFLTLDIVFESF